jgi:putative PIN family toxin of toxin-antitoxin system
VAITVVIDSNLYIAALLTTDPSSPTVRLFRAVIGGEIEGFTSPFQLSEVVDVLNRRRFRKKVSVDAAMGFVGLIKDRLTVVAGAYVDLDVVPKDVKDNPIVAIALEAQARYLITDDAKHLLPLKVIAISGFRPIQVVGLEDFMALHGL